MDGSGAGLVYRGPFVYRKSSGGNAGSSLTLESTDFGARQYSPTLRRWMTPDPLSEKYYGVSPYAFCNNNPVNFVDPDGRKILGASKNDAKKVVSDMHEIFPCPAYSTMCLSDELIVLDTTAIIAL